MMKALLRVVNVVVSMLAVYAAANFALSVKAEAQEKSRQPATSTQSTSVRITAEDIRRTPSSISMQPRILSSQAKSKYASAKEKLRSISGLRKGSRSKRMLR